MNNCAEGAHCSWGSVQSDMPLPPPVLNTPTTGGGSGMGTECFCMMTVPMSSTSTLYNVQCTYIPAALCCCSVLCGQHNSYVRNICSNLLLTVKPIYSWRWHLRDGIVESTECITRSMYTSDNSFPLPVLSLSLPPPALHSPLPSPLPGCPRSWSCSIIFPTLMAALCGRRK